MSPRDAELFTNLYDALVNARPPSAAGAGRWGLLQACNMASHVEQEAGCTSLGLVARAIAEVLWTSMTNADIEPQRSLEIARAAAREWAHMRLDSGGPRRRRSAAVAV